MDLSNALTPGLLFFIFCSSSAGVKSGSEFEVRFYLPLHLNFPRLTVSTVCCWIPLLGTDSAAASADSSSATPLTGSNAAFF